ncbi:conserved hypothetical protein [Leishmania major strain Friedlin]|uniref:Uncharacterized protein n=1 Tax=Leishmania major TaxID=5664 RepID=Q4Q1S7_LEIMA|nr:conserved hypothetical protein [Leishmania major strain Friedlin]CAG9583669.1 hypothetical_protein_-_conserved [Leishmania major strain Friedlin]CAJ09102.1 conserved hypothetical protein [Leishmania major strain Friedlin]|eukprot:XP_001686721.1 conserved hypothetical protein [Leishmania major strain Friedlin]
MEEEEELSMVIPVPGSGVSSQRAASEYSEHAGKSSAQDASTSAGNPAVPFSRSTTPVAFRRGPSAARGSDEQDQVSIPTPSIQRMKPSMSPEADGSTAAHTQRPSGRSAVSSSSIVFSGADSTTGTSILFASDGASSEGVRNGEVSPLSRSPCAVKNGKSGNVAAVKQQTQYDEVAQDAAAVVDLTSDSSFDLHIEEDEQAEEPPAVAAAADEAPQWKRKSSKASKRPTPGSSKLASSISKKEATNKRVEKAGKSTSRATPAVSSADPAPKGSRARRGAKVAVPSQQASPARASRGHPGTLSASERKANTPGAEQRLASFSRDHDLVASPLLSSRSSSGGSLSHRESRGSVNSVGEESADRFPNREHHRNCGLRPTPGEDTEEDDEDRRSISRAERVGGHGASRSHKSVIADTGERGRSSRAQREGAKGQAWRTHSGASRTDHCRGRELSREGHRHLSSCSPVRRHGSRRLTVGSLHGGALAHECLMKLRQHSREGGFDWPRPHHRRRSGEAPPHHRCHCRSESRAKAPSPLCADRMPLHRTSFYDDYTDNDVYATAAVASLERFGDLSERCRRRSSREGGDDGYGAAVVQSARSVASSVFSGDDVEEKEELLTSSHFDDRRSSTRGRRVDSALSPRSKARYADSKPGETLCRQELLKYDHGDRRAFELRKGGSVHRRNGTAARNHRRRGAEWEPDYYYWNEPRRGYSLDSGGCGCSWCPQSYHSPRPAAPPARESPLRSRCGLYRPDSPSDAPPGEVRYQSLRPLASSPVRRHRARSAASGTQATPLRRASQSPASSVASVPLSEKKLLGEVEWKLDALEKQIANEDAERERAMMRSPFERLYHLNNRRDRDERRNKVFQLSLLERIRDRIVSGSLKEDIARKEERLRKQEEMLTSPNGVFVRLYQNSSPRRSSNAAAEGSDCKSVGEGNRDGRASVNTTGVSSQRASTARSRMSAAESQELCNRLYETAAIVKQKKEAMRKQSVEERQRQQAEELLIARLAGQIQLERSRTRASSKRRPKTPAQLEDEARAALEKLRKEDPEGYEKKVLRGRLLSPAERVMQAERLWKHGYISKAKLEAQKKVLELKKCTFQPTINEFSGSAGVAGSGETRGKGGGGTNDDKHLSAGTDRAQRHRKANRFEELYRKGIQAKVRGETLREERDREARLRILRSRMVSDHHFRRRVELDPLLAERFMKSLVV